MNHFDFFIINLLFLLFYDILIHKKIYTFVFSFKGGIKMNETDIVVSTKDNAISIDNTKEIKKKTYLIIKRISDILLSLIAIMILSPMILMVAIAIKLDSKGPVFFKHKRVGKNGREFGVYKFRSMVDHAEELLNTLTPQQKADFEENFKLKNDFRITRVGKFIRKTSIDELPQLINVLIGNMSLVGPRPIVAKELEKYGMLQKQFLSVTPGLTGYWACNGRSNTTYEQRIDMELYYIKNRSLWLDIKIIFKTTIGVLKGDGAK